MKPALLFLVISAGVASISLGNAIDVDPVLLGDCIHGRLQFERNRLYAFDYETVTENAIEGTSRRIPKTKLTSLVSIQHLQDCDFLMQVGSLRLYESFSNDTTFTLSHHSDKMAAAMSAYPLRFSFRNGGTIGKIKPAVNDHDVKILNMKRGILSAFQVNLNQEKNATVRERDVSGDCEVVYTDKGAPEKRKLKKEKDLSSCQKRTAVHSNVEGVAYGERSPLTSSKATCTYTFHRLGHLRRVHCEELNLLKPFSSQDKAGAYIRTHQKLTLSKVQTVYSKKTLPYQTFRVESLLFAHEHFESEIGNHFSKAKSLLKALADRSYELSRQNSAAQFSELVTIFRRLGINELMDLIKEFGDCELTGQCTKGRGDSYRSFLLDGIAQCGSTNCVVTMVGLVAKGRIPSDQVDKLLGAIAFTQEPTEKMLQIIMIHHQQTKRPSALLLLGTLVHKYCRHTPEICADVMLSDTIRAIDSYFIQLLGSSCKATTIEQSWQIFYTLKGIGNAGRPQNSAPILLRCAQDAEHVNISIAAIQATRRMTKSSVVMDAMRGMLTNKNVDVERRMQSFFALMQNPTNGDIQLAADMVNDNRESGQLRSLIVSYLKGIRTSKDPSQKRLIERFNNILSSRALVDLQLPATRFSKAIEYSGYVDYLQIGGSVQGLVLFHPESYVPRSVGLNLTTFVLGEAVNILELDARAEGLETLLYKWFGPGGLVTRENVQKMFTVPDDLPGETTANRRKRSTTSQGFSYDEFDNQVNIKESSPQATLSVKMFGNEIQLFTLADFPLLSGDMNDFNVVEKLYELVKGSQVTLKKNLVFLEADQVMPTISGMATRLRLKGSAIVTTHVQGKVETKNFFFGPKALTLKGSVAPSATVQLSVTMETDGVYSSLGTHLTATTFTAANISGQIDYEVDKEFKVKVDVAKKPTDIFTFNHEMFHSVNGKRYDITGSPKRAALDVCSNDFLNATAIIGLDLCANMSVPVSSHNMNAPYVPLTGPINFGVTLLPRDTGLSYYSLIVKKENDMYRVTIDTPGSVYSRHASINLGLTVRKDRGVIGATFGKSEKGLTLEYRFSNVTNEIEALLASNLTTSPMTLALNYFNRTDQYTLDRHIGAKLHFKMRNYNIIQTVAYEDKYMYWAVRSMTGYAPGKNVRVDFEGHYQPQFMLLSAVHLPTKTRAVLRMRPSYPFSAVTFNLTHGEPRLNVNSSCEWHMVKTEVKCQYKKMPEKQSGMGYMRWIQEVNGQAFNLVGAYNNISASWNGSYENQGKQGKIITSNVTIPNHSLKMLLSINRTDVISRNVLDGHVVGLHGNIDLSKQKKTVRISSTALNHTAGVMASFNALNSAQYEFCLGGRYDVKHANACMTAFSSDSRKELQIEAAVPQSKISSRFTLTPGQRFTSLVKQDDRTVSDVGVEVRRDTKQAFFHFVVPQLSISTRATVGLVSKATSKRIDVFVTDRHSTIASRSAFLDLTHEPGNHALELSVSAMGQPMYSWKVAATNKSTEKETNHRLSWSASHGTSGSSYFMIANLNRNEHLFNWTCNMQLPQSTQNLNVVYKKSTHFKISGGPLVLEGRLLPAPKLGFHYRQHKGVFSVEKVDKMLIVLSSLLNNEYVFTHDTQSKTNTLTLPLTNGSKVEIKLSFPGPQKAIVTAFIGKEGAWKSYELLGITFGSNGNEVDIDLNHAKVRQVVKFLETHRNNYTGIIKDSLLKYSRFALSAMQMSQPEIDSILSVAKQFDYKTLPKNFTGSISSVVKSIVAVVSPSLEGLIKNSIVSSLQNITQEIADHEGKLMLLAKSEIKAAISQFINLVQGTSFLSEDGLLKLYNGAIKIGGKVYAKRLLLESAKEVLTFFELTQFNIPVFKNGTVASRLVEINVDRLENNFDTEIARLVDIFFEEYVAIKRPSMANAQKIALDYAEKYTGNATRLLAGFASPMAVRTIVKTTHRLLTVLKTWSYDERATLSSNVNTLIAKLDTKDMSEAFFRRLVTDTIEKQLATLDLPQQVHTMRQALSTRNATIALTTALELFLDALNVTDDQRSNIDDLLKTNDLNSFLTRLSGLVLEKSKASAEIRHKFTRFLRDRNSKALLEGLYMHAVDHYPIPDMLRTELKLAYINRNITGLVREATAYGLTHLNMKKEMEVMLLELLVKQNYEGFVERILVHFVDSSDEIPTDAKALLRLLVKGEQRVVDVLKALYEMARTRTKGYALPLKLFATFDNFLVTKNITSFSFDVLGIVEEVLLTQLNTTSRVDALKTLHAKVKVSTEKFIAHALARLPLDWRRDLDQVISMLRKSFERVTVQQLREDWVATLIALVDTTVDVVQPYVVDVTSKQVMANLRILAKNYFEAAYIGNETAEALFNRTTAIIENRLHFGLRLLSQFLPTETHQFVSTYVQGGKIDYFGIYQDALNADYLSDANQRRMLGIVKSISKKSLEELMRFSGGLKLKATALTLARLVKALNYTEVNAVIDKVEKLDWVKYSDLSYPSLLKRSSDIMRAIGLREYNGRSIDSYVNQNFRSGVVLMANALSTYAEFDVEVRNYLKLITKTLAEYRTKGQGFFLKSAMSIKHVVANSNKYQRFLLDITMPMLGGAVARLQTLPMPDGTLASEKVQNMVKRIRQLDRWNMTSEWMELIPEMGETNVHMGVTEMLEYADDFIRRFQIVLAQTVAGKFGSHWTRFDSEVKFLLSTLKEFLEKSQSDPLDILSNKTATKLIWLHERVQTYAILQDRRCPFTPSVYMKPFFGNITMTTSQWMETYLGSKAEEVLAAHVPVLFLNATLFVSERLRHLMLKMHEIQTSLKKVEFLRDPKKYVDGIPDLIAKNLNTQFLRFRFVLKNMISKLEVLVHNYEAAALAELRAFEVTAQQGVNYAFRDLQKHSVYRVDPGFVYGRLRAYSQLLNIYLGNYTTMAARYADKWVMQIDEMLAKAEKTVTQYTKDLQLKNRLSLWQQQLTNITDRAEVRAQLYRSYISGNGTLLLQGYLKTLDAIIPAITGNYSAYANLYKQKMINGLVMIKNKVTKFLEVLPGDMQQRHTTAQQLYTALKGNIVQNSTTFGDAVDSFVDTLAKNVTEYMQLVNKHIKFNRESFVMTLRPPSFGKGTDLWFLSESVASKLTQTYAELLVKFNQVVDRKWEDELIERGKANYIESLNGAYSTVEGALLSNKPEESLTLLHSKVLSSMARGETMFSAAVFNYQSHADATLRNLVYSIMHAYKIRVQSVLRKADSEGGGVEAVTGSLPPIPKIVGLWNLAKNVFKPLTRTALFFGQHVFTFDGTYAHIPDRAQCTYLLARDFRSGLFTILYSNGHVTVEFKDSRTTLSRDRKVEVQALAPIDGRAVAVVTFTELPVQLSNTSVVLYHDVVRIVNSYGVTVNCQLEHLICNVTVAGFYHNKTLGILGTNNVEYSDDMRMPNGKLAADMIEFVNAWEITKRSECQIRGPSDYLPTCRKSPSQHCRRLFKNTMSPFKDAFNRVNSLPFLTACEYETSQCNADPKFAHCESAKAYINVARRYNVALRMLPECARCNDLPNQQSNIGDRSVHRATASGKSVDVVLLVKQTTDMRHVVASLKDLVRRLDKQMQYKAVDRRFAVVAFNGAGIRNEPHVQTGNGHVFGDIDDLLTAVNALRFDGDAAMTPISRGLDSLRHAARLTLRPLAAKIFFLVDNDITYNGDLQLMADVSELLKQDGVSLNVFNQYKFKKSVIGKGADNTRYHMKLPKGEQFEYIEMPPTDNYLPLVKDTNGAVLTVKSLMSQSEKWMKALPIAVGRIVDKQIGKHAGHCHVCQCVVNFEGSGVTKCVANPNAEC